MKFRGFVFLFNLFIIFIGCAYFNTFYNAKSAYREGMSLKESGQSAQAKIKFDRVIEKSALVINRWPKSRWADDALFLIGRSYYEKGEYSRAVRSFEQLPLAFPRSRFIPEAELYRGLALLREGRTGVAKVILDGVKANYPRFRVVADFHLALSALERGEVQEGVASLSAFVQRYPRSRYRKEALRQLAEGCLRLGDYRTAEEWFWRYATVEPQPRLRAEAKTKIARCRLAEGKFEEAVKMVQDVLGRYSALDDELNLILGKAYLGMGKEEAALSVFARVKSNNALGAEAAFLTGNFYEESRDFVRARAYYDTAKMRRADSEHGVLATKRLSLLAAIAEDTLHRRTPAERLFLLAEVFNLNLEEYDTALVVYQKVYDSFPDSEWAPKALFARAWILRRIKGDTVATEEALKKIVAEYQETEYAREAKRWLEELNIKQ